MNGPGKNRGRAMQTVTKAKASSRWKIGANQLRLRLGRMLIKKRYFRGIENHGLLRAAFFSQVLERGVSELWHG